MKTHEQKYDELFSVIDRKNYADSTEKRARREIAKMREADIDPASSDKFELYAQTLHPVSQRYLRSIINAWNKVKLKASGSSDYRYDTEEFFWLNLEDAKKLIKHSEIIQQPSHNKSDENTSLFDLQRQIIIGLFLGLGLRRGEAEELTWSCINENEVEIYRNGKKHRSLPISESLKEMLMRWKKATGGEGRVLRKIDRNGVLGDSLDGPSIAKVVAECGPSAGIEHLTPKKLRLGFAHIAIQIGTLDQVKKWLGHRDLSQTVRYLSSNDETQSSVCHALYGESTKREG